MEAITKLPDELENQIPHELQLVRKFYFQHMGGE